MTQGHKIVEDGWAGEYNPHSRSRPTHTQRRTQLQLHKYALSHFLLESNPQTNRLMDGGMGRLIDGPVGGLMDRPTGGLDRPVLKELIVHN